MNSKAIAVECARLAMERAATDVHEEMSRGLSSLATIVATAPMVGVFGCACGIAGSFRGTVGPMSAILGALAGGLSEAIILVALGLGIGILAFVWYQRLRDSVDSLDVEMKTASLALMNRLLALP